MNNKFPLLLSPIKIRNTFLKSRLCYPNASPHFLQGPETFPAESTISFYADIARAGAAYIDLNEWSNPRQRLEGKCDSIRMQNFDYTDPSTSNYFSQLAEDVRYYGSKMCCILMPKFPAGYSLSGGPVFRPTVPEPDMTEMLPKERLPEVVDDVVRRALMFKEMGYEMMMHPMMHLNKWKNTRPDEYGSQSPENAARLSLEICKAVKEACGNDFLIELGVYGEIDYTYTTEWLIEVLKVLEPYVDIVQVKEKDGARNHPTGHHFHKYDHMSGPIYGRKIKQAGLNLVVALNGGYQDPAEMEHYLREGCCDMFSNSRGFIADIDFYSKIVNGNEDDIVPCLWCNKCHGMDKGPWLTYCSVNPVIGNSHKLHRLVPPVGKSQRVAIVGGGPIGMRAALMAAERGHEVTLYEKTAQLGGQLFHADYFSWKWPLKDYRDWLVAQIGKHKHITVCLNTEATPQMVKAGSFDAVIAAPGAVANLPNSIQGIWDEHGQRVPGIYTCLEVIGHEDMVGQHCIVIGGSEVGVETAMYLCENGHTVHVTTRQTVLCHDNNGPHSPRMAHMDIGPDGKEHRVTAWDAYEGLTHVEEATVIAVTPTSVTYVKNGEETTLSCDTVIICGGMNACLDEALSFYGSADRFFITGDAEKVGSLQTGNHSAMGKVMQI